MSPSACVSSSTAMSLKSSTIGFPRIGSQRQMKIALERYWKGTSSESDLLSSLHAVETEAWGAQAAAGIQSIALDSTLYDHVLDTVFWLGATPKRFQHLQGLDQYFAMARGSDGSPALDMSKLYDTNYHYLVPELEEGFVLHPNLEHVLARVRRGQALLGKKAAVPCILGPVTFVALARGATSTPAALSTLLPVYEELFVKLSELGVGEVQLHEPSLVTSGGSGLQASFEDAYKRLSGVAVRCGLRLSLVSFYDDLEEEVYSWAVKLPVACLHLDFLGVTGSAFANRNLEWVQTHGWPAGLDLGAGVVDGRSVWADKTGHAAGVLRSLIAAGVAPTRLVVSSSTPLQHLPYSLDGEPVKSIDPDLRLRLAFAVQKLAEISEVARLVAQQPDGVSATTGVAASAAATDELSANNLLTRSEPYSSRRLQQIQLPPFPTTTIGSFPQTAAVRAARATYRAGKTTRAEYDQAMGAHIGMAVGVQEALGLDVLVHGEAERTDMVEFFGQALEGLHFTANGWVQSYGSRYVRPPIIVSDVRFLKPMTTTEFKLAQSLTLKPMKGMLTGPVTVLNWSFPRKDISRKAQAMQLAAALRQEVAALESAGCKVVQVDEPALREGLPLKTARHASYLRWAVDAFRLTTAVAAPGTQVVTHLCYSDFQDIMQAIEEMDADVLTIENSRSGNEMMAALAGAGYTRDIGPGVYDVHSPLVPSVDFVKEKIRSFVASGVLSGQYDRLWVNPDCGLKTRGWPETMAALSNMVRAAAECRAELPNLADYTGSSLASTAGASKLHTAGGGACCAGHGC